MDREVMGEDERHQELESGLQRVTKDETELVRCLLYNYVQMGRLWQTMVGCVVTILMTNTLGTLGVGEERESLPSFQQRGIG